LKEIRAINPSCVIQLQFLVILNFWLRKALGKRLIGKFVLNVSFFVGRIPS